MTGLDDWIGRTEQRTDVLHAQPCRFMQATLGREASLTDGDALPPLWHWLFFLEAKPLGALGRDGHPAKGEFLPPVSLPRRMWAGGRFAFHQPLIIGRAASKTSTIKNIAEKQGRSGPLCFVTVAHEIHQDGGLCVVEEHDIVYRADPATPTSTLAGQHQPRSKPRSKPRRIPHFLSKFSPPKSCCFAILR